MRIKIIEERKNNNLNSTFYVEGSDDLYAEFDIDNSILADILAPNIIKIWDKVNSDYYEIREGKAWFLTWFLQNKLLKNGEFMNKFFKPGKYYNICGNLYECILHNNAKHGIPDIISLTNMNKQIALIKRELIQEGYTYKNDRDIFGKAKSKYVYNINLESDIKNNILDIFMIVVHNAVTTYNSFTPGGAHYEYGHCEIFPEKHKEHLQWISSDETTEIN
jgi:hypothetical protein